jgi:ubiquitin-conjugating enzyme E2 variant
LESKKGHVLEHPTCFLDSSFKMSVQPRNFKLLDEYDCAIGKGGKTLLGKHDGYISYNLTNDDDMSLSHWSGIIIGPQGKPIGEFIYNISIFVPAEYPTVPPEVKFISPRIKMDCVDNSGRVNLSKISPPFQWSPEKNIADVLVALRENMHNSKVCNESASLGNTSYQ